MHRQKHTHTRTERKQATKKAPVQSQGSISIAPRLSQKTTNNVDSENGEPSSKAVQQDDAFLKIGRAHV